MASYQAIKHRFADMKMWLEGSHGVTERARAVQHGDDRSAEARQRGGVLPRRPVPAIVQECIQLHGGIGVTWEHDLHLYLRRVTQNPTLYGSAAQTVERIATLLGG